MSCFGFPSQNTGHRGYLGQACRVAAFGMLVLLVSGCGSSVDPPAASIPSNTKSSEETKDGKTIPEVVKGPTIVIEEPGPPPPPPEVEITTSHGSIHVQLFRDKAPVTVENFLANYVSTKFYDGTIFHYIDDGFMIAGGGYLPDLQPKPTREEIFNEANDEMKNVKGTIAMARHPKYVNSATSQFFFNLADNPGLDHQGTEEGQEPGYCVFGKVIAGMDVLERIAKVNVADTEKFPNLPNDPVVIQSIKRLK